MDAADIVLFCAALFICYKPLKEFARLAPQMRDIVADYQSLENLENLERKTPFFQYADEPRIMLANVAFSYQGAQENAVFLDLTREIRMNRPLLLRGANGAGKTTLLRLLSGLEIPTKGVIQMPKSAEDGMFFLSQRFQYPSISWLAEELHGKEWGAAARTLFNALQVEGLLNKKGHSSGELQRLGLAWAVVSGAPLLFLDEPFAFMQQSIRLPAFKAFWNATTESGQWWMMASHEDVPENYKLRMDIWDL
jgi:ABC-type Mn2+/Zn2+ transport system ATPase subunit